MGPVAEFLPAPNIVDVRDIGATSATIDFFRTLGGAIGVSVLGALLASEIHTSITDGLPTMGVKPGAGGDTAGSLELQHMPAPVMHSVRPAYGDATGHIFLVVLCVAVISLVAVLFIREVPLRTTVRMEERLEADSPAVVGAEINGFGPGLDGFGSGPDAADLGADALLDEDERAKLAAEIAELERDLAGYRPRDAAGEVIAESGSDLGRHNVGKYAVHE